MIDFKTRIDWSLREWNFDRFYGTEKTPHYASVPKDYAENKKWRKKLFEVGSSDPDRAEEILQLCKEDILFWVNAFCYTFSPKDYPDDPHRLFITYPYQDDALLRIQDAIGKYDLPCVKSRDMGATWMFVLALRHRWQFFSGQAFLASSRKLEFVDSKIPKSIFWKIDYIDKHMPSWMLPTGRESGEKDFNRTRGHLENADNGSVIDGEATVPDLARGDRLTAVFMDEAAVMENADRIAKSTRDATRCRLQNSTPNGTGGDGTQFYLSCIRDPDRTLVLWWPLHPEKSLGLYRATDNEIEILDKEYEFPEDYDFIRDGKYRSPWYDNECSRSSSDVEIAQELDLDFQRSGAPFFDQDLLDRLMAKTTNPSFIGELVEGKGPEDPIEMVASPGGNLRVWIEQEIPKDEILIIGCDIAAGTGGSLASNSVASVFRPKTGEKIAEYSTNRLDPREFAVSVMVLARFFNNAYLIWEANGYGLMFGKVVSVEMSYSRIYWYTAVERIDGKQSKRPGWWSTKITKKFVLTQYSMALKQGKFKNPSKKAIIECREYVHGPNGSVDHDSSLLATDASEQGENHGDRVIADALSWHLGKDYGNLLEKEPPKKLNMWSVAGRRDIHLRQKVKQTEDW